MKKTSKYHLTNLFQKFGRLQKSDHFLFNPVCLRKSAGFKNPATLGLLSVNFINDGDNHSVIKI